MPINVTVRVSNALVPDAMMRDAKGIISFPIEYAQFAFEGHGRNIGEDSLIRRENAIKREVVRDLRRTQNTRHVVEAAARRHLSEMRRFELNAPGAGPPAKNPYRNRLRRITGNLSDTAFIQVE